jgi:hypothetical protein
VKIVERVLGDVSRKFSVYSKAVVFIKSRTICIFDDELSGPVIYGFSKLEINKYKVSDDEQYWDLHIALPSEKTTYYPLMVQDLEVRFE